MGRLLVIFHDSNYYSGATRSMIDLIRKWRELGITVDCVFPSHGTASKKLELEGISCEYLKYYQIRCNINGNSCWEFVKGWGKVLVSIPDLWSLRKRVILNNYDYIYSNTSSIYFGYYLSKMTHTSHVWHIREFGGADQERVGFDGNKGFANRLNRTKHIIAISNSIRDYLVTIGVKRDLIHVVYNDVMYYPKILSKIEFLNNKLNVLSCGGLQRNKGHIIAIKSVEELKKRNIPVLLRIAGNINTPYYSVLESYVIENDLSKEVDFCGFVENMDELRAGCDIAIVGSTAEAFGRITIEGMLSGLVVVGANSCGTAELINDNENGFLFAVDDYINLADVLERLYLNKDICKQIASVGRTYAQQFCTGKAAKYIINILEN